MSVCTPLRARQDSGTRRLRLACVLSDSCGIASASQRRLAASGGLRGAVPARGRWPVADARVACARGWQLRLGTLTGFQYFSCYLRGREELLVTINREVPAATGGHLGSPGDVTASPSPAPSPSPHKPISPDPLGKPPASPASREITNAADTECVFLAGVQQRVADLWRMAACGSACASLFICVLNVSRQAGNSPYLAH